MRKKILLDDYEKEIEEALSKGKIVSAPNLEETKSITLRVNKEDLIKIKAKAKQNTLPYQTLINLLIRQYVRGSATLVL